MEVTEEAKKKVGRPRIGNKSFIMTIPEPLSGAIDKLADELNVGPQEAIRRILNAWMILDGRVDKSINHKPKHWAHSRRKKEVQEN